MTRAAGGAVHSWTEQPLSLDAECRAADLPAA